MRDEQCESIEVRIEMKNVKEKHAQRVKFIRIIFVIINIVTTNSYPPNMNLAVKHRAWFDRIVTPKSSKYYGHDQLLLCIYMGESSPNYSAHIRHYPETYNVQKKNEMDAIIVRNTYL